MTRRMYDAAYPPARPPHWDAVAAYIGGDTPHVWTAAEWARQPVRYRLPIYVRSNPSGLIARVMARLRVHSIAGGAARTIAKAHARLRSGAFAVTAASDSAVAIAWLKAHNAPRGCVVALDLETAINGPYVRAFDAALVAAGYRVVAYGSLSTIYHNPRTSGGYWVAHYTYSPHMESGAVMTQWADGQSYDSNLVADSVPLWDTKAPTPTPVPPPVPPPPSPPEDEEIDMAQRDLLPGLTAKTGLGMPPKTGGYSFVEFYTDNTYTNGSTIKAFDPVSLRVVIRRANGTWQHVEPFMVGRTPKDKTQGQWRIKLDDKNATYVSVTRLSGTGDEEIQVAAY